MNGILGFGTVGKATAALLRTNLITDLIEGRGTLSVDALRVECETIFICLPTPYCFAQSRLDIATVEKAVEQLKDRRLVIRSTVNLGDCERLKFVAPRLVYWPEFMGETPGHPYQDPLGRGTLLVAGDPEDRRSLVRTLSKHINAGIRFRLTGFREAEFAKLSENRAIAWRVAEFQELFLACESIGLDYYEVREMVYGDDDRFNLWWSFAFEDALGLSSKCLPKDVLAWVSSSEFSSQTARIVEFLADLKEGPSREKRVSV